MGAWLAIGAIGLLAGVSGAHRGSRSARREKFVFWRSCPNMSYETVNYITDRVRSEEIAYATFARNVNLREMRDEDHPAMYRISAPDNWTISFHKSRLPSGKLIYYFLWSGIEHVFVGSEDWPDFDEEHRLAEMEY